MDNFLINVAINDSGEWFANFTDGSIPLCANTYEDAIMEADMILSENDSIVWGSEEEYYE
jgi:hypothetical protein